MPGPEKAPGEPIRVNVEFVHNFTTDSSINPNKEK